MKILSKNSLKYTNWRCFTGIKPIPLNASFIESRLATCANMKPWTGWFMYEGLNEYTDERGRWEDDGGHAR